MNPDPAVEAALGRPKVTVPLNRSGTGLLPALFAVMETKVVLETNGVLIGVAGISLWICSESMDMVCTQEFSDVVKRLFRSTALPLTKDVKLSISFRWSRLREKTVGDGRYLKIFINKLVEP